MGDVISLEDRRRTSNNPDDDSHLSGRMRCTHCRHEWIGVSPVGTYTGFECPSCGLGHGTFYTHATGEECELWSCFCGNTAFTIERNKGTRCMCCGRIQSF